METKTILGIDIAKRKFDVALLINNKFKTKVFQNNLTGFEALLEWLKKQSIDQIHACLEATGCYGHALATYLFNEHFLVSVVNPARIKAFAQSQLARNKTDKLDAKLIAQFCQLMKPTSWQPLPAATQTLHALVRRREALLNLQRQEANRIIEADIAIKPSIEAVLNTINEQIKLIEQTIEKHINNHPNLREQRDLLLTINGIGKKTANLILASVPDVSQFKHAKQLAAYAGLNPQQHQSGSSVQGRTHLSKIGHSRLRKGLYFPAITAAKYNPVIQAFSAKLRQAGKTPMCIIAASMRKLIHIIFGVLKSGKPFDANFFAKSA
jgi:transposase